MANIWKKKFDNGKIFEFKSQLSYYYCKQNVTKRGFLFRSASNFENGLFGLFVNKSCE